MIIAAFDGSCFMNPGGHAHAGYWYKRAGISISGPSPTHTDLSVSDGPLMSCNVAEWAALNALLRDLSPWKNERIEISGDSNLVIRQASGASKISSKSRGLYLPYYHVGMKLIAGFQNLIFQWVPRESNSLADEQSKCALGMSHDMRRLRLNKPRSMSIAPI